MPLPGNGTLSLQGQGRPGDTLYSKPKRAMIVRMSAETFEALEGFPNQPKMEFEFGENSGIHIGDSFFAMRPLEEGSPHELYLRTSSAAKPMAPLKLYANVTGKFTVERQLEIVKHKMRDTTLAAEKQRSERKAILIDTPPAPRPGAKKRKEPQIMRRPVHVSDTHLPSVTQHVASPRPSSSQGGADVTSPRHRLIHCLALAARTAEDALRLVGGKDSDAASRRELANILEEVAEKVPTAKGSAQDAPRWQLKTESWTQVRPYEWGKLDHAERTQLARQTRAALSRLKIPESDPVWEHSRYRETGGVPTVAGVASSKGAAGAGTSANGAKPEPKRPMMPKEAKPKKPKTEGTRKKPSDITIAKDESARPLKDVVGKGKGKAVTESSAALNSPASAIPPGRRLPGSGFRVKASATPPATPASPSGSQPPRRTGPVDARESKREVPSPSGHARPAPPIPPPATSQAQKPVKTSLTGSAARAQTKAKASPAPTVRSETASGKKRALDTTSAATNRAARKTREVTYSSDSDEPERAPKRRKTEERPRPRRDDDEHKEKNREGGRDRDLLPSKKAVKREYSPLAPPRVKIKQEPSPLPPAPSPIGRVRSPLAPPQRERDRAAPSSGSSSRSEHREQPRQSSGSAKPRRKSPIYTSSSSSDEEPERNAREEQRRRVAEAKERPPRQKKHDSVFKARPLPHDRAGLRQYYKSCFRLYIRLYNDKVSRKDQLEKMLAHGDSTSISMSDSDSEMDVDLLDPEPMAVFVAEFKAVVDEMEKIKQAWTKLGGEVDAEGELV
ncbi:hypothetical protein B0H21DRAFT_805422 [Amylocystis lapponica]|nr:hypothetical protein B0H21DRAFT_805422 [Amylocystis lapponica]